MADHPLRVTMIGRRVAPAHGPGGLENSVRGQVLELARAGVGVDLWTELPADEARRRLAEQDYGEPVRLHWVAPGPLPLGRRRGTVIFDRITNYPHWARRVAAAIEDPGDVVHVQGLAGLGAAERCGSDVWRVPLVLTTHGMEEFLVGGVKHLLYAPFRAGMRRIAAASQRVVVTDRALLDVVTDFLDLAPGQAVVIPNAIDPEAGPATSDKAAAARLLQRAGQGERDFRLLSVGRLEANKGFEILVSALAEASDGLGDWAWTLVGDGPRRAAIERAIAVAGLADRCVLTGRVPETTKNGLFALADWFVHPTLFEGSSLVTLEAMAHGLPVLGTRAGGLPDKIEAGASGLLVEPGQVDDLAAALRVAQGAPAGEWGARAREILLQRFSWEAVGPALVTLYQDLTFRR